MSQAHARLSPSGAHRWMACPGSVTLEDGLPESSSKYADEGICAHALAAVALEEDKDAAAYVGRKFDGFEVTDDMANDVQVYVDYVRRLAGQYTNVETQFERWLPANALYGFPPVEDPLDAPEGSGTADAIVMCPKEGNNPDRPASMHVIDLKFGRGVKVYAGENKQGMMYLANAMDALDSVLEEFERFHFHIVQPRVEGGWVDEAVYSRAEIVAFAAEVQMAGNHALSVLQHAKPYADGVNVHPEALLAALNPGEEQCRWCKAKAKCPALGEAVLGTVFNTETDVKGMFTPVEQLTEEHLNLVPALTHTLNHHMRLVGMIEDWCLAIRAEVERRLFEGEAFDDWKLVQGRKGARKWLDAAIAEKHMRKMKMKTDEIYNQVVKTPPQVEKLIGKEYPRKWQKLNALITQEEGKPSVAPMSDKRPVYSPTTAGDFAPADNSDIL